jgi:hypothetical protein
MHPQQHPLTKSTPQPAAHPPGHQHRLRLRQLLQQLAVQQQQLLLKAVHVASKQLRGRSTLLLLLPFSTAAGAARQEGAVTGCCQGTSLQGQAGRSQGEHVMNSDAWCREAQQYRCTTQQYRCTTQQYRCTTQQYRRTTPQSCLHTCFSSGTSSSAAACHGVAPPHAPMSPPVHDSTILSQSHTMQRPGLCGGTPPPPAMPPLPTNLHR